MESTRRKLEQVCLFLGMLDCLSLILFQDVCVDLRELILSRQLYSWSKCDLEFIPKIINKFRRSLRVLIVDSKDEPFSQKVSRVRIFLAGKNTREGLY